jgi:hypothetical protein
MLPVQTIPSMPLLSIRYPASCGMATRSPITSALFAKEDLIDQRHSADYGCFRPEAAISSQDATFGNTVGFSRAGEAARRAIVDAPKP